MAIKLHHSARSAVSLIAIVALSACTTGPSSAFNKGKYAPAIAAPHAGPTTAKGQFSMEQIIEKAKKHGYSDISEIEREDDRFCVEARDQDGKRVEVFFDAKTGEIVPDVDVHGPARSDTLSMAEIIAKAKEQGYSDISEVEREGDRYCVKARDAEGKEVEIFLDRKTGERVTEGAKGVKDKKEAEKSEDLSKDEVIAKLKEQGYPEVSKIERERENDQYWAMATDTDGEKFELHVNAQTGVITRKEKKGK